jgi:hypothetical protein
MTQDIQANDTITTTDDAQLTSEERGAAAISDGTSKKDQEWKDAHPHKCPCWMCMHVTKPWVEALDQAQRENERLENEIKDLRAAYEHKPGHGSSQIGQ